MTPKKPEWFELTENGDTYSGIKRIDKKLPIITLVVAGAVVLGGSIFANANNEPSAVAETPAVAQSVANSQTPISQSASPASSTPAQPSHAKASTPKAPSGKSSSGVNGLAVPKISNVPQRGEREHEGRERGEREHEGGEHEGRDDD
jgi:hypothetical protein